MGTGELLKLLKTLDVSYFKNADFEVSFNSKSDEKVPDRELSAVGTPVPPQKIPTGNTGKASRKTKAPPASAVPIVDMAIPHHVNEVMSLLRLDDNSLAERLFPDPLQTPGEAKES